jgi:hypothetical protein
MMSGPDNPDDVDTAPVIARDSARVEYCSVLSQPGSEIEVVIEPEPPMVDPVLFLSTNPRHASVHVERVTLGKKLLDDERSPTLRYKFGSPVRGVVSRDAPLRIFLANDGAFQVRIGASLVSGEERRTDGSYRLKGKQIEE